MAFDEKLKIDILTLLSQVEAISSIKLESRTIESWIENLKEASNSPEKLQLAWYPILEMINKCYWCTEQDTSKFSLIDRRPALSAVRQACLTDLQKIETEPNRKIFAQQIALLYLVYANIFHLYPSGHPIFYSAYCDVMKESEIFIKSNNLLDTRASALWHYLKACGSLRSCGVMHGELEHRSRILNNIQKELDSAVDEPSRAELMKEKQEYQSRIKQNEQQLQAYLIESQRSIEAVRTHKMKGDLDVTWIEIRLQLFSPDTYNSLTYAFKTIKDNALPIVAGVASMAVGAYVFIRPNL